MDRAKRQEDAMLTIDNAVNVTFPGAKLGILAMANVAPTAPLNPSAVAEGMEEIRRRYGHLDRAGLKNTRPIRSYIDYYRAFGYSYHVLSQLESVLNGKKQFRAESGLLQSMFLTEIESMLLTAGHDVSLLKLPLRLAIAAEGETYLSLSGNEVAAVPGDLTVCDGNGVISSILRGPDSQSRITVSTTDALFTVYAPPGIDTDPILAALGKLRERILSFSPAAETMNLRVYENA
jgi:DNA/RNA-binding domain of Phe-tRNA-synthetase-like protein